jgi:hypothetical protein
MPTISVSRAEVPEVRAAGKVKRWKRRFRRALIRFSDWQTTLHVHLCSTCRDLRKSPDNHA